MTPRYSLSDPILAYKNEDQVVFYLYTCLINCLFSMMDRAGRDISTATGTPDLADKLIESCERVINLGLYAACYLSITLSSEFR